MRTLGDQTATCRPEALPTKGTRMKTIRIGGGQGFWGDNNDAAIHMIRHGDIQYLACDYLAELTLSIMQRQRQKDPKAGYARDFIGLMKETLEDCLERGIRVVTNAGGMNVAGAADALQQVAQGTGRRCRIASITGDDLLGRLDELEASGIPIVNMDTGQELKEIRSRIVNANVYFGHQPIRRALAEGADIVLTGRSTDSSMFLAPLAHEFDWAENDYDNLARGILSGHLLECGGQGAGGNFDYGWQTVPDLENLGYPIAEVTGTTLTITKAPDCGGLISEQSLKEQLYYEIHDPARYYTPDVIADFSRIRLMETGENRVRVDGVAGTAPTDTLKLCLGITAGYRIVAYLPYAWPFAIEKARKAEDILRKILKKRGLKAEAMRFDLLGVNALHLNTAGEPDYAPNEVVLRVAIRTNDKAEAAKLAPEIAPFNLNGPPANCFFGGRPKPIEIIALWPTLIPRDAVKLNVSIREVR